MSRMDSYSASIREEQKAILNGLLGIIYDNYDTTRRIQASVDGIYRDSVQPLTVNFKVPNAQYKHNWANRMVVALLLIVIALIITAIFLVCFFHCRRANSEERSPLHANRKSHPIEI